MYVFDVPLSRSIVSFVSSTVVQQIDRIADVEPDTKVP